MTASPTHTYAPPSRKFLARLQQLEKLGGCSDFEVIRCVVSAYALQASQQGLWVAEHLAIPGVEGQQQQGAVRQCDLFQRPTDVWLHGFNVSLVVYNCGSEGAAGMPFDLLEATSNSTLARCLGQALQRTAGYASAVQGLDTCQPPGTLRLGICCWEVDGSHVRDLLLSVQHEAAANGQPSQTGAKQRRSSGAREAAWPVPEANGKPLCVAVTSLEQGLALLHAAQQSSSAWCPAAATPSRAADRGSRSSPVTPSGADTAPPTYSSMHQPDPAGPCTPPLLEPRPGATAHVFVRLVLHDTITGHSHSLHIAALAGTCGLCKPLPPPAAGAGAGASGLQRPLVGSDGSRSKLALDWVCLRMLLAELVKRQADDTGIPRPLPLGGCLLCHHLAPLLAGNVRPHLLALLPQPRPAAGASAVVQTAQAQAQRELQVLSAAAGITNVASRGSHASSGSEVQELQARQAAPADMPQLLEILVASHARQQAAALQAAARAAAAAEAAATRQAAAAAEEADRAEAAAAALERAKQRQASARRREETSEEEEAAQDAGGSSGPEDERVPHSEPEDQQPALLVGGLARLQRRLQALQRAREAREAAAAAEATMVVAEDGSPPPPSTLPGVAIGIAPAGAGPEAAHGAGSLGRQQCERRFPQADAELQQRQGSAKRQRPAADDGVSSSGGGAPQPRRQQTSSGRMACGPAGHDRAVSVQPTASVQMRATGLGLGGEPHSQGGEGACPQRQLHQGLASNHGPLQELRSLQTAQLGSRSHAASCSNAPSPAAADLEFQQQQRLRQPAEAEAERQERKRLQQLQLQFDRLYHGLVPKRQQRLERQQREAAEQQRRPTATDTAHERLRRRLPSLSAAAADLGLGSTAAKLVAELDPDHGGTCPRYSRVTEGQRAGGAAASPDRMGARPPWRMHHGGQRSKSCGRAMERSRGRGRLRASSGTGAVFARYGRYDAGHGYSLMVQHAGGRGAAAAAAAGRGAGAVSGKRIHGGDDLDGMDDGDDDEVIARGLRLLGAHSAPASPGGSGGGRRGGAAEPGPRSRSRHWGAGDDVARNERPSSEQASHSEPGSGSIGDRGGDDAGSSGSSSDEGDGNGRGGEDSGGGGVVKGEGSEPRQQRRPANGDSRGLCQQLSNSSGGSYQQIAVCDDSAVAAASSYSSGRYQQVPWHEEDVAGGGSSFGSFPRRTPGHEIDGSAASGSTQPPTQAAYEQSRISSSSSYQQLLSADGHDQHAADGLRGPPPALQASFNPARSRSHSSRASSKCPASVSATGATFASGDGSDVAGADAAALAGLEAQRSDQQQPRPRQGQDLAAAAGRSVLPTAAGGASSYYAGSGRSGLLQALLVGAEAGPARQAEALPSPLSFLGAVCLLEGGEGTQGECEEGADGGRQPLQSGSSMEAVGVAPQGPVHGPGYGLRRPALQQQQQEPGAGRKAGGSAAHGVDSGTEAPAGTRRAGSSSFGGASGQLAGERSKGGEGAVRAAQGRGPSHSGGHARGAAALSGRSGSADSVGSHGSCSGESLAAPRASCSTAASVACAAPAGTGYPQWPGSGNDSAPVPAAADILRKGDAERRQVPQQGQPNTATATAGLLGAVAADGGGAGAGGSGGGPAAADLQRRNRALMGVLERAATGSDALQGRLYEAQLEIMELRASLELRDGDHAREVARLRAALAHAAEASGVGPLVAAYEQHVEALQRQVLGLVSGQRQVALQAAETELMALQAAGAMGASTAISRAAAAAAPLLLPMPSALGLPASTADAQRAAGTFGALRVALRQATDQVSELRAELWEAQRHERAALLAARQMERLGGDAAAREVQAARKAVQEAQAAAQAADERSAAAERAAQQLQQENSMLRNQLAAEGKLSEQLGALADRSNQWLKAGFGLGPVPGATQQAAAAENRGSGCGRAGAAARQPVPQTRQGGYAQGGAPMSNVTNSPAGQHASAPWPGLR